MSTADSPPARRRPPPRSSLRRWVFASLVKTGITVTVLGLCGVLVAALGLALIWPKLPELSAMTDYRPPVPLRIYTADNVLIGEFGQERRNVLRFHEIPDVMKAAVLAAEDDRFYEHGGIDWLGVARATLTNLATLSKRQGASTITMQVARNFYLSSEKSWARKLFELPLTLKIEASLSKDQILELYMNQIFLGHRAYGFAAAARTYFGKPLADITAAEAALLAGIPKAPSHMNPINNLPRAIVRQHYVLGRMKGLGYLTDAEYDEAMAQAIVVRSTEAKSASGYAVHADHPAELARQLVYSLYGEEAYGHGLNVYTTIHSQDQETAYRALRTSVLDYTRRAPYPGPEAQLDLPSGIENNPEAFDELLDGVHEDYPDHDGLLAGVVLSATPKQIRVARSAHEIITIDRPAALAIVARALRPSAKPAARLQRGSVVYLYKNGAHWETVNLPAVQAALVAVTPQDGAIRAMVGGFDAASPFNRVTQAWRQPGSLLKPFVYAAALERGFTPATLISDQPFSQIAEQAGGEDWTPKNYGDVYEPMLTLREGLYKSKNMVSVRILQAITPAYVQSYLTRFGLPASRHPAFLSMALGAGSATPLQMAGAYAVFANGGYRVNPYLIERVTDAEGQVLMQAQPRVAGDVNARAIDPRTAFVMTDILKGATVAGTAARARALRRHDIAGKTGTTNHSVDAWFAGYTPSQVAVAWLGYDQPQSLGERETGGGAALPIWMGYMQHALKGVPEHRPIQPGGLLRVDGDYYYQEFPPGQAVATLGLAPDALLTPDAPADLPVLPGLSDAATPAPAVTQTPLTPSETDPLGDFLQNLTRTHPATPPPPAPPMQPFFNPSAGDWPQTGN